MRSVYNDRYPDGDVFSLPHNMLLEHFRIRNSLPHLECHIYT